MRSGHCSRIVMRERHASGMYLGYAIADLEVTKITEEGRGWDKQLSKIATLPLNPVIQGIR